MKSVGCEVVRIITLTFLIKFFWLQQAAVSSLIPLKPIRLYGPSTTWQADIVSDFPVNIVKHLTAKNTDIFFRNC